MNQGSLKDSLKGILNNAELKILHRSYDLIGDIAILDIPNELQKKEKTIATQLCKTHPHIKVVCKKIGNHYGKFRKQRLKIIYGEKRKETIHKENNILLKLHTEQCYFSPRLSYERMRIAKQVKKDENILVMFSGTGPYTFGLAKNTKAKSIIGIELNPTAHKYALENQILNKATNTQCLLGDASKLVQPLKTKFDRILMPLPKGAENFLSTAYKAAKESTIIHFYDFQHESDFKLSKEKVLESCKKAKISCKILRFVRCGQYSPGKYRVSVNFIVKA